MKAKKGEEKGKWQKAIIGFVMAAIMLGSVLVAMVPTSVGRPTANEIDVGDTIYIGEQSLAFDVDGNGVYGEAGTSDDFAILEGVPGTITENEPPLTLSATYTVPDVTEGKYYFDANANGILDPGEFYIFVDTTEITGDIILNTATLDSVVGESIPTSSEIVFKVETNFGDKIPGACADIKVVDPNGVVINSIEGQALTVPILGTTMFVGDPAPKTTAPPYPDAIDLTDLDTGTYTIRIKTDKATCNMLDISSPEYEFMVREEEFSIEAEKDTVYRGEDIALTVTGNPKAFYYLTVTGVDITAPPEIKDVADVKALSGPAVISPEAPNLAAWIKTGIDGIADIKIATTGADDRTYTINVYDTTEIFVPMFAPDAVVAASPLTTDDDSVDVEVLPPEVTFDMPGIATVGEEVTIKGAVSAGNCVDIVIEDADWVFDDEPVDKNNEFEVDWDTSGLFIGPHVIDVYIDCPISGWMDPYAYYDIDEDGSAVIWLVAPRLTAEQPRNVIAEGDDYTIEGIATGVDEVDIVLIGPVGYPHMAGFDVLNDLEITSTSVSDGEFSEDITMTEGVNTGTWIAMVFSPGRDGVYGDSWCGAGNLNSAFPPHIFAGKTQDQIAEILKDYTIDVAGSDDLLCLLTFRVDSLGFVEFRPIEPVVVGEPLNVSGATNREPGTTIAIWTIEGPIMLPPVIAKVEWPTADQGVFSATINSSGAVPGTYTLEANDGEGNTDTATVEIRVPSPPAPEVSISTDKKEYSPGEVINTTIRLSNPTSSTQSMLFKWYFIRDYNNWTEIEQTTINLSANSDQSSMTSIPVEDWGNESFCGCYIVSLTNTTTNNVVSVDSASWIYLPSAECKSKTSAEIVKEIKKGVEGVKLSI